jgi:hypothetical protein
MKGAANSNVTAAATHVDRNAVSAVLGPVVNTLSLTRTAA